MSVLIKVAQKEAANLSLLRRLCLTYVFEGLPLFERYLMEHSFKCWTKKVDITDDEKKQLEYCAWILVRNEKGKFIKQKETYKEHGIDWRKVYHLPKVPHGQPY